MPRLLLLILFSLIVIQCTKSPNSEGASEQGREQHVFILDAIPAHIEEIENLTVFPGDSEPKYSIDLIPKQTYGKTGEPYLTKIFRIVVDDQGRVIILDSRLSDYSTLIHVYNDDGSYYTQLGGQGKGPGEYEHVFGLEAKASKIFVLDFTSQRLNEYSTKDYSLVRTIPLEQWKSGGEFGYVEARNDGNYLLSISDSRSKLGRLETKYLVMDSDGNSVDFEPLIFPAGFRIGVGEVIRPTMPLEFMGRTIRAISDNDVLHTVFTRDFLIKKYDARGNYKSTIYYPIQGLPFNLDVHTPRSPFEPNVRVVRNAFASLDDALPETYPVVEALMVDDENRIWVAVPMDTRYEMFEWWILAPSGELLAKLHRPRDLQFVVKDGYLYGNEVDENTEVEYVAKYRIELTEANMYINQAY